MCELGALGSPVVVVGQPLRTILRNKYIACYVIAAWVFGFSCYRDWTFHEMMKVQPQVEVNSAVQIAAGAFVVVGQILVLSSFYRLGVTGTFLGTLHAHSLLLVSPHPRSP